MLKYPVVLSFVVVLLLSDYSYSQTTTAPPFRGDTAGFVNGRAIRRKAYIEMFSMVSSEIKPRMTDSLTSQEILKVHQKTWDNLILECALMDSIEKKGIAVTDIEVRSSLERDPPQFLKAQFTDSTGKFLKEDYLSALRDPRNNDLLDTVLQIMIPAMKKEKLSKVLIASITPTDEELWKAYKEKKGATREKFESEKENLRSEKLKETEGPFFERWVASVKATAKVIDYRTMK